MKTDELYKKLDEFKDKIKLRLIELTNEDKMFYKEKNEEMYGLFRTVNERTEDDFYI